MHRLDFERLADGVVGAAAIASTIVANPLLRPFYCKWGATEHEARKPLPGDELIAQPRLQYTRAISIKAPPQRVWPWLIQIGYGRAAWYGYDLPKQIVPELQALQLGDEIKLRADLGLRVRQLQAPRVLVLSDRRWASWAFVLEDPEGRELPAHAGGTRLLVRWRLDHAPTGAPELLWKGLVEPIGFVIERRMTRGLKRRAEG